MIEQQIIGTKNDLIESIKIAATAHYQIRILEKDITVNLKFYQDCCSVLNKQPMSLHSLSMIQGKEWYIWRELKDHFKFFGDLNLVFSNTGGKLKIQFCEESGKKLVVPKKDINLSHYIILPNTQTAAEKEKLLLDLKKQLKQLFIAKYYEEFPQEEFEKWKKSRRVARTGQSLTKTKSIHSYFRLALRGANMLTEEQGVIELSKYPIKLFADKNVASTYWGLLARLYGEKFVIFSKQYSEHNLTSLMTITQQPSALLKRMSTEALKYKVYQILGDTLRSPEVLNFLRELNPLLHQYIIDTWLHVYHPPNMNEDVKNALIEAGEIFGFGQDEMKLRFIEYHLNKLKVLSFAVYPRNHAFARISEDVQEVVKRVYTLEKFVAQKQVPLDIVDENQLTLQFN